MEKPRRTSASHKFSGVIERASQLGGKRAFDIIKKEGQKTFLDRESGDERIQYLSQVYQEIDDGLSSEELSELEINPPKKPRFPFFALFLAIIKDVIDIVVAVYSLGTLAWLASIITSVFIGIFLWFWMLGKLGRARKLILKWAAKRVIILLGIDIIIPGAPMAVVFVLMAHYKKTAVVESIFKVLEFIKSDEEKYKKELRQKRRKLRKDFDGELQRAA